MVKEPPGVGSKAIVGRDQKLSTPAMYSHTEVAFSEGRDCWLQDVDGNIYLDFSSGIATTNVGHCHPDVVSAIKSQSERLIHISRHVGYYEPYVKYMEELRDAASGALPNARVFFANSGSEAIEAALKLVRYSSRKLSVIAFTPSFHGRTMGALSLTASKARQRRYLTSLMPGVEHVPYPYCYRCPFGQEYPDCDLLCVNYIHDTVLQRVVSPEDVAAMVVEPIGGEAGYVIPPPEFLPRIRDLCDENDILLVIDEVQSGFGRTGKMFAVEHSGIHADLLTMGKSVGGGMPLGAMLARSELLEKWPADAHGTTFGGSPLSCVAGMATLGVLRRNKLMDNAKKVGESVMKRLADLKARHKSIGDVRGKGLMIGVEFVKNRETREPALDLVPAIMRESLKSGLLIISCGISGIRIAPPLTITTETADLGIDILDQAIAKVEGRM